MAPKRSREAQVAKQTKAAEAVRDATGSAAKALIDQWMTDNPDKVSELALWLADGGLKAKAAAKEEGKMSKGTAHIHDLPKKWMADHLAMLEPLLSKEFIDLIYRYNPSMLVTLLKLGLGIREEENKGPIKITKYFPRNYIALEETSRLRYDFYGNRLKRFAAYSKHCMEQIAEGDAAVQSFVSNMDVDKYGVWSLEEEFCPEAEKKVFHLCHPNGLKVTISSDV